MLDYHINTKKFHKDKKSQQTIEQNIKHQRNGIWITLFNANIFLFYIGCFYSPAVVFVISHFKKYNWFFTPFQYFITRILLYQSHVIPWNYAKFLAYARELGFIQQVGGRYRFTHDLLRKHFASMRDYQKILN